MEKLTIRTILSQAWQAAKSNMILFCGMWVTYMLAIMLLLGLEFVFEKETSMGLFLLLPDVVLTAVSSWFFAGFSLQAVRQRKVGERIEGSFIHFLLNFLLTYFIVMLPIVLLAAPLVVVLTNSIVQPMSAFMEGFFYLSLIVFMVFTFWYIVRTSMVHFILLDKRLGAWQAIKLSFAITKGHCWKIVSIVLLCMLSLVVGVLLLFVGIFPAYAFCLCTIAKLYDTLMRMYEQKQLSLAEEVTDGE